MIELDCRQCGERLEAPSDMIGERIECPNCGTGSLIPGNPKKRAHATKNQPSGSGGLFDALLGNASSISPDTVQHETTPLLVPGETVSLVFKLVRDLIVFTTWRVIYIDKQGITGKKVEYRSIPYASITLFAAETAGRFDRDAELKIFVSGLSLPFEWQFRKGGSDILEVQRALALAVYRSKSKA